MKKVRQDLYIGDYGDAILFLSGRKSGITHILSVLPLCLEHKAEEFTPLGPPSDKNAFYKVSRELQDKCEDFSGVPVRKVIPVEDSKEENLLEYLEDALKFIDEGRRHGIVLVHCGGGRSRSAAVLTAYLMWQEQLLLADALASLKECSPDVCPNQGFMQQLQMLQDYGFQGHKQLSVSKQKSNKKKSNVKSAVEAMARCKLCNRRMPIQHYRASELSEL